MPQEQPEPEYAARLAEIRAIAKRMLSQNSSKEFGEAIWLPSEG